jgi:hypothetical protein
VQKKQFRCKRKHSSSKQLWAKCMYLCSEIHR